MLGSLPDIGIRHATSGLLLRRSADHVIELEVDGKSQRKTLTGRRFLDARFHVGNKISLCRRGARRRIAAMALQRAVEISQGRGLSGIPVCDQNSRAAATAIG